MNILFVTPYYEPTIVGGAEISMQLIAEGMAQRGHNVSVLTIGTQDDESILNGVKVIRRFQKKLYGAWSAPLEARKKNVKERFLEFWYANYPERVKVQEYITYIKKLQCDVVVLNSNEECFQRASLWKGIYEVKLPCILTLRDPILLEKHIGRINLDKIYVKHVKKQLKWISAYAAPSNYMVSLYRNKGLQISNCRVIYNSVNINMRTFCGTKKKRIVYAGSLVEKKGIKTLVQAFTELKKEYSDVELVLIGKGEISHLVDSSEVTIIPWINREELYDYISKSWVLILPSEWPEAFGRVIVESIYCGTLAIGSDAGAIPELFGKEKEFVFKQKDSNNLKEIMKMILNMSVLEYKEKLDLLQQKFKKFSYNQYIDSWEGYIKEVVNKQEF